MPPTPSDMREVPERPEMDCQGRDELQEASFSSSRCFLGYADTRNAGKTTEKYTKNASDLDKSGSFVVSSGCWAPGLSPGGDSDAICSETPVLFGGHFATFLGFCSQQFAMHFLGALLLCVVVNKGVQMDPQNGGSGWKCG